MDYKIIYNIQQVAIEDVGDVHSVISEIRFFHDIIENDDILGRRLYVVHPKYEKGEELTSDRLNKEILYLIIEKSLGEDQINHMKRLLIEDYNKNKNGIENKKYIDIK